MANGKQNRLSGLYGLSRFNMMKDAQLHQVMWYIAPMVCEANRQGVSVHCSHSLYLPLKYNISLLLHRSACRKPTDRGDSKEATLKLKTINCIWQSYRKQVAGG